jgi:tetratricopeptide (TPR) repeat protein/tRNA A-37 threonylcarbamoyl transferase component Bud32
MPERIDASVSGSRTLDAGQASTMDGDRAPAPTPGEGQSDPPTDRAGRFALLRTLGTGAMGVVHAAYDDVLDRRVAIKFIHPERAMSAHDRERLLREARAMARLSHPNVVHVYEAGEDRGRLFIAMEYVPGRTLRAWMADEGARAQWPAIVALFRAIAAGLSAAHAAGVVHRDFKPDNVLVARDGTPKVADFGLADLDATLDTAEASMIATTERHEVTDLTRTGAIVGTPVYLAPERYHGRPADARTDQFAFCAALWEALYGVRPFDGETLAAIAAKVTRGERTEPPGDRVVPGSVRAIVQRGLEVDPARRWPTMEALAAALAGVTARPRRRRLFGIAVVLAGGLAFAALRWPTSEVCTGASAQAEATWNDTRRQAVRSAIEGTSLEFAGATWARIEPRLDAWALAWVEARTDACTATAKRREQSEAVMDLRIACLQRAERSFTAVVDVLARADASTVERADAVLDGLPPIDACADVTALSAEVEGPPADEREAVDAARMRLAEAAALRHSGHASEAAAAVDAAEAELRDVAYAPIATEVAVERAHVLDDRDDPLAAETVARRALELALQSDQRELARRTTLLLIKILGFDGDRSAEALTLVEVARGLSADTSEHDAELHSALGAVYQARADHRLAVTHFRAALALKSRGADPDALDLVLRRLELALALADGGELDEAEALYGPALTAVDEAFGPGHPKAIAAHQNHGVLLVHQGRLREAETELRAALARIVARGDHGAPMAIDVRSVLAIALMRQGRAAEAVTELRAVVAALERTLGPRHPRVGRQRGNLGQALLENGEHDAAAEENRAALAILYEELGGEHSDVLGMRNNYASLLHAIGRHEEALVEHRMCAEGRAAALGPEHPDTATSHYNIGVVSMALGRAADAEAEARRALATFRAVLGEEHRLVFAAQSLLGQALLQQGRHTEAATALEHALAGQDREGMPPRKAGETAAALAEAVWPSDRDGARALARRSIALYEKAGPASDDRRTAVQAWLAEHGG